MILKRKPKLLKLVLSSLFMIIILSIATLALLVILLWLSYCLVCGAIFARETFDGILIICTTSAIIIMIVWLVSKKLWLLVRAFLDGYGEQEMKMMSDD